MNWVRSRPLTFEELTSVVGWVEQRKDRLYSLKYLQNAKRTLRKITSHYEFLEDMGIPSLAKARREAEYRVGMNADLNPNLAMEFKLTWT